MIPYELGGVYSFGQQGIPDGCRRPGECDSGYSERMANSPTPLVYLCRVRVGHGPKSFKSRAELLERSPTADTPTRAFGPASMQQSAQPPESTDEPDPGAVIDWLLKQTR